MSMCVLVTILALPAFTAQDRPAQPPTRVPIAAQAPPMVESIKIFIRGTAASDGELRFNFTPAGGETMVIRVQVGTKIPADEVVRDLTKAMKAVISPDYLVDRYDPAVIKISLNKKNAPFRLTLAAMTANGLSVRFE
jgi:hypothetical protein